MKRSKPNNKDIKLQTDLTRGQKGHHKAQKSHPLQLIDGRDRGLTARLCVCSAVRA